MIEFFSGLVAVLMWLPFSLVGLTQELYLNLSNQPLSETIEPGVVFSFKQAENLGLNPRATFLAMLEDLKPKSLRAIAYWDRVERVDDEFDFSELDFQLQEAEKRNIKTTLIIGEKVPRWPECHYPGWLSLAQSDEKRQEEVLEYLQTVVNRYKNYPQLEFWQLENEPSLAFGKCPGFNKKAFEQKLKLLKSLSEKPVMVTTSGELDTWLRAFLYGDKIGFSVYRRFFVSLPSLAGLSFKRVGLNYPLPPEFYKAKSDFYGLAFKKQTMVTEFQLEPWLDKNLKDASFEEQFKELDFEDFKNQIEYARKIGVQRVYFWGTEWWYWLKQNNHPEFLDYVQQKVFNLSLDSEKDN